MLEITQDNYFEAAQALYWYCYDYHNGIGCPLYSILSARLGYKPAPTETGVSADDDSILFYGLLESGAIDPTETLTEITNLCL